MARATIQSRVRRATVLWIEADPVFGGSQSQVQFPVELSSFFRLPKAPAVGAQTRIAVEIAGVRYPAKKMDFHHNGMWRLNLPTKRQGLGGYRGQLLAFQRTTASNCFLLWLVPSSSPLARRLRTAARTARGLAFTPREDGGRRYFGVL